MSWVNRRTASSPASCSGLPVRRLSTTSAGTRTLSASVECAATQYSHPFSTLAVINTTCLACNAVIPWTRSRDPEASRRGTKARVNGMAGLLIRSGISSPNKASPASARPKWTRVALVRSRLMPSQWRGLGLMPPGHHKRLGGG